MGLGRKWTDEEITLLRSDLTNTEIAEKINRTTLSVRDARYHYTGHNVEKAKQRIRPTVINQSDSEFRIIALCNKLGVKIEGVR